MAQLASALAWGARGREFKSPHPDHKKSMFQQLQPLTWDEVFEDWRAREGTNPSWVRVAREVKGWPDWESWRRFTANQLRLPERSWALVRSTEPLHDIPKLLVGPYSGWQAYFSDEQKNTKTFEDLVARTEHADHLEQITASLVKNFPAETRGIGLRTSSGTIVLIEGHHRATAIAWAAKHHLPIDVRTVNLALADLPDEELGLLDTTLERGSSRFPKTSAD